MSLRHKATERRRDYLGLLLILLLAAALRLGRSDVVEYFHDDAMLATLALELADGRSFPLVGILSSTGIPNPPVSVYLLAIPFALSSDPAFTIHAIMLWNVLGVGLLWRLARRYGGCRIALIAGFAYAVNPWAVLFSRKIWAQELHTPIILFGLLLLLYGFYESRDGDGSRRRVLLAQCLSAPVLLFGFQFHFASWPLILLFPTALWLGRKRICARALVAGIALSLVVSLPYVIGLAQTLSVDPTRISDALNRSAARGLGISASSASAIIQLASGSGLEFWLAPNQAAKVAAAYPPLYYLSFALLPALLLGLRSVYQRSRPFASLISIWAFLPSLLLLVEWTPVYIHYFIPSIPALALLIGYGADSLLRYATRWRPLQIAASLIFALIMAQQVQQWVAALNYVAEQHIDYPGFTTPLANLSPLRAELASYNDVVVLAGGMSWNLHHEVALWDTLLGDAACVRTIIPDGYAVFPRHPFAAVIAPGAPAGGVTDLYRHERPEIFPTRRGGNDYELYRWQKTPTWSGDSITPIERERFANGPALSGYGLEDGRVMLEWQLPARQVGADYQFSAQLYDAQGERLDQLDATFWHGRHWCEGDRLLTWGPIDIDARAATLKVALYRLGIGKAAGSIQNIETLDSQGNAKGQSVDIPLQKRDD